MRYFIEFCYRGSNYFGYQRQPKQISVQQVMEEGLSLILREKIDIVGAGRTDTGVHARQMYAHFDFEGEMGGNVVKRLNAYLPSDISVVRVFEVRGEAHARFDAVSRSYEYYISRKKNPFWSELSYQYEGELDVEMMNRGCEILFEYRDFQCFSKTHTDVRTYNCDIKEARWEEEGDFLVFHISADRFLRNMVRAIVGTMLEIGRGKVSLEEFREIIEGKDRCKAGFSVPGKGLFLTKVEYDFENMRL